MFTRTTETLEKIPDGNKTASCTHSIQSETFPSGAFRMEFHSERERWFMSILIRLCPFGLFLCYCMLRCSPPLIGRQQDYVPLSSCDRGGTRNIRTVCSTWQRSISKNNKVKIKIILSTNMSECTNQCCRAELKTRASEGSDGVKQGSSLLSQNISRSESRGPDTGCFSTHHTVKMSWMFKDRI